MNGLPAQVIKMNEEADKQLKAIHNANAQEPYVDDSLKDKPEDQKPELESVGVPAKDTGANAEAEEWKHKYQVLQGKYNKEVKEAKPIQDAEREISVLKSDIAQLNRKIGESQTTIRELEDKLQEKEKQESEKVAVPQSLISLLSEEEREHFDTEGIDQKSLEILGNVMRKYIPQPRSQSQDDSPKVSKDDIDFIRNEAQKSRERIEKAFYADLDKSVPDWTSINRSEDFNNWLDKQIKYTSITRREALQNAHGQFDSSAVIDMFNDFKSTQQQEAKPTLQPKRNPEDLVEPSSSVSGGEEKPNARGKLYSVAEVKKFYGDYTKGKIKDEDYKKMDQEFMKANAEGRIRG